MNLAVVVLAAGASTRLGACKALVDLAGEPPLARLLAAADAARPAALVVVGGAHAEALAGWLATHPGRATLVRHSGWAQGRLGSVAAAAAALPGRDLLLAPVDVPLVSAATFASLAAAFRAAGAPPRGWLAPEHGGRPGHPVVLGRALAAEAAGLAPDVPLRTLRERAAPLWTAPVPDPAIHDDLDTPADLERLRRRLASEPRESGSP